MGSQVTGGLEIQTTPAKNTSKPLFLWRVQWFNIIQVHGGQWPILRFWTRFWIWLWFLMHKNYGGGWEVPTRRFCSKGFWMKSAPVRWLPRLDRLTYSTYRGWPWSRYIFAMSIEQWKTKHWLFLADIGHEILQPPFKVYTKGSSKLCLGWFLKTCQFQHSLRFNYWHPLEGSRCWGWNPPRLSELSRH